ncbi:MAG: SMP-30/gluconolactonase/LRE family protein [Verrucomicrobiae bacterium]|nr:SMP-30/gluconolactonase/LRE family protein [Verrucomicrobiae bacterium]
MTDSNSSTPATGLDRRSFLGTAATAAAAAALSPAVLAARDYGTGQPVRYPDPDLIVLDPRFGKYRLGNTPIQRLYHDPNMLWAEGPAWNAVGRYLLWSDIPNDCQHRWIEDDGRVTVFRRPAGNSNGNTFDFEGRQIACEHGNRRVVRYERDGGVTVLADRWDGKRLNAPNDVVVHPDGGIWFTDPGYGSMMNYEGNKAPLEIKEAVYRIDPQSGRMDLVTDELDKPNGLCFSPDYRKLYVADTGRPRDIAVWDVVDGRSLARRRQFVAMAMEKRTVQGRSGPRTLGGNGGSDGIRTDVDGNVWSAAGWVGDGYDGVHIFAPDGARIGMILLPEICSNLCFGGAKRNRLFMTASQSIYAVYVETQGSHLT